MKVHGDWPGVITIRDGWAKATARPWNADLPYGYLRLERGGAGFLRAATGHVLGYGVELVASPPLLDSAAPAWVQAGFFPFLNLHLYRRSLIGAIPPGRHGVRQEPPDFDALAEIDRRSFGPLWRSTASGLRESYRATLQRTVLVTRAGEDPEGFAIVGASGLTAYLQRIAVSPAHQGRGWGSRLIVGALRWAARHGAASILLNTPPANRAAAAFYRSAGFHRLPDRLRVLRYPRDQFPAFTDPV